MKTTTNILAAGVLLTSLASGLGQPVITCQPQNQTNVAGTTAMFSVCATGAPPLIYQWRSYANATTFTNIPWGTEATLFLTNVQPTSQRFRVVITDSANLSATSVLAALTVLVPPSITLQPSNQTLEIGSTASFATIATGTTPFSYQWRLDEMFLPGKTNASLTLTNIQLTNAGGYSVIVTNVAGSATSMVAELKVSLPMFTLITNSPVTTNIGHHHSSAWADYDDDGMLDLFVSGSRGTPNLLFHYEGNGIFIRTTNNSIATEGGYSGLGGLRQQRISRSFCYPR